MNIQEAVAKNTGEQSIGQRFSNAGKGMISYILENGQSEQQTSGQPSGIGQIGRFYSPKSGNKGNGISKIAEQLIGAFGQTGGK